MLPEPRPPALPPGVTIRAPGEGELGRLFQQVDWAKTPIGPREAWPTTLQGYVRMMLMLPTPAIIFWGPDQVQLYNDGYAVIMGPRHPKYLGATYRECWPDTYPTIYPWMQRVLEGEVVEVDRTLIPVTRHGFEEEAFFTFTFSPLRDDDGKIGGLLQIVTEVTAAVLADRRQRTIRALAAPADVHGVRPPEEHIADVLRANPHDVPWAALFLPDPAGGELRLRASVGESALHGPDADAVAQRVWSRAETLETAGGLALPIRRTAAEPLYGVVLLGASPRLRFDDAYRDFFRRVAHELAGFLALRQEAALAEQLRLALDSAKLGTWVLDVKTNRVRLSDRTASFIGPGGASEHDFTELNTQRIHPDDLRRVNDAWRSAVDNRTLYACEYRVVRPDGEVRWLQSWGRATYAPDGEPLNFSGVTLDITSTRNLVEQLSSAVKARDQFLSIASHELKTPLTSLFLQLQGQKRALGREGAAPFDPSRLIGQLEKQALRLSRLVNDMLDVSRIDTGKLEVARVPTDVCALSADLVERLRPQFEAASVPLELEHCEQVYVAGDSDRLEQVLVNLLTNALRYGSGTPVRVRVAREEGRAVISVHDGGRGIPPEHQARIFERFERAVSESEISGLGLGLFIAREIVRAHGGDIRVESAPGRGATFYVGLPLAAG